MYAANALTAREHSVLELLATPLTQSAIARELHVSVNTVKTHVSHVYAKLAVATRDQAVSKARAEGLLASRADVARDEGIFEAILLHTSDLITIVDADRHLVWANPSFAAMLGEPPDAHIGRPAWEIVHPDDRARLGGIFGEIAAQPGGSVRFECRLAHADGTWRQVEVHQVNRLHDPAVRGFVGTSRAL